jgi:DNA-binding response OmpR family regulator
MSEAGPGKARLLVVDDDAGSRDLLVELLAGEGFVVEAFPDADAAWARLEKTRTGVDAILLDWLMPGRSGLDLLQQIKRDARLQTIPVIFATAMADREAMLRGIAAGAYYYVTKPLDREVLLSIVRTAIEDHARYQGLQEALRRGVDAVATLAEGRFLFRTVEQATALATLLSHAFPDPERTVVGLGELLINAVEHGNLGITYDEKSALLADGRWEREVARRLALPENQGKQVEVHFVRTREAIAVTIRDEGPGFDWRRFLTVTPERVFDTHGRGIAMANLMSFERVEYADPGNRVTATVALEPRAAAE